MSVKQVSINGTSYNIAQVNAEIQSDMLDDLYQLTITAFKFTDDTEIKPQELSDLIGCYASQGKKEVAKRLRKNAILKTIKSGEERPVDIMDFGGQIDSYNLLTAHAIMENLADFFTRLGKERAARLSNQAELEAE